MKHEAEGLVEEALSAVATASSPDALAEIEIRFLGKKGALTRLLRSMGSLPDAERPAFGKRVNEAKASIGEALARRRGDIEAEVLRVRLADPEFDPTAPGIAPEVGTLHPLTLVQQRVESIFESMGFAVLDYPEAESEYFNFEAINIPADHPAREMQDTFWLADGNLLRTHTSAGQVRAMREYGVPLRAVFPGRCFRYEETDASHEHTFHQVEGLMIDRDLSVANLVSAMTVLLREIFERDVKVRLRPGFFPFVEPGFELDVNCLNCGGKGCPVCKHGGWVELLPCGMVHPFVIRSGGFDPAEWSGWAFGLGLSRLVLMKYEITDIRLLASGDLRFLSQFRGAWR